MGKTLEHKNAQNPNVSQRFNCAAGLACKESSSVLSALRQGGSARPDFDRASKSLVQQILTESHVKRERERERDRGLKVYF